jgi:hypothetical protein
MRGMKRLLLASLLAVAALGAGASTAQAAAPRIVIVSGQPLAHQVVISDWNEIFAIAGELTRARPASRAQLANRPRLRFSMFWGPRWSDYVKSGKRVAALRPRQADQAGSFYPRWRGQPALMDLPWAGEWPRPVSAKALAILRRYGVPVGLT